MKVTKVGGPILTERLRTSHKKSYPNRQPIITPPIIATAVPSSTRNGNVIQNKNNMVALDRQSGSGHSCILIPNDDMIQVRSMEHGRIVSELVLPPTLLPSSSGFVELFEMKHDGDKDDNDGGKDDNNGDEELEKVKHDDASADDDDDDDDDAIADKDDDANSDKDNDGNSDEDDDGDDENNINEDDEEENDDNDGKDDKENDENNDDLKKGKDGDNNVNNGNDKVEQKKPKKRKSKKIRNIKIYAVTIIRLPKVAHLTNNNTDATNSKALIQCLLNNKDDDNDTAHHHHNDDDDDDNNKQEWAVLAACSRGILLEWSLSSILPSTTTFSSSSSSSPTLPQVTPRRILLLPNFGKVTHLTIPPHTIGLAYGLVHPVNCHKASCLVRISIPPFQRDRSNSDDSEDDEDDGIDDDEEEEDTGEVQLVFLSNNKEFHFLDKFKVYSKDFKGFKPASTIPVEFYPFQLHSSTYVHESMDGKASVDIFVMMVQLRGFSIFYEPYDPPSSSSYSPLTPNNGSSADTSTGTPDSKHESIPKAKKKQQERYRKQRNRLVHFPRLKSSPSLTTATMSPNGQDIAIGYKDGRIDAISSILPLTKQYLDHQNQASKTTASTEPPKHPMSQMLTRTIHWHPVAVQTLCYQSTNGTAEPSLLSGGEEAVLVAWNIERGLNRPSLLLPRVAKGAIRHIATTPPGIGTGTEILVLCKDNTLQLIHGHNHATRWKVQGLATSSNECVPVAHPSPRPIPPNQPGIKQKYQKNNNNNNYKNQSKNNSQMNNNKNQNQNDNNHNNNHTEQELTTDRDYLPSKPILTIDPLTKMPILTNLEGAPGYIHWYDPVSRQVVGELEVAPYNRICRKEPCDLAHPRPVVTHLAIGAGGKDMVTIDVSFSENKYLGMETKMTVEGVRVDEDDYASGDYSSHSTDSKEAMLSRIIHVKFWSWKGHRDSSSSVDLAMPYEMVAAMPSPHGTKYGDVRSIAISTDGTRACTLGMDRGNFHVWAKVESSTIITTNTTTGRNQNQQNQPPSPPWKRCYKIAGPAGMRGSKESSTPPPEGACAFSQDGSVLAIAYGETVSLWDHEKATMIHSVRIGMGAGYMGWARATQLQFVKVPTEVLLAVGPSIVAAIPPYGPGYLGGENGSWSYRLKTVQKERLYTGVGENRRRGRLELAVVTPLPTRKEVAVALRDTQNIENHEVETTKVVILDMATGEPKKMKKKRIMKQESQSQPQSKAKSDSDSREWCYWDVPAKIVAMCDVSASAKRGGSGWAGGGARLLALTDRNEMLLLEADDGWEEEEEELRIEKQRQRRRFFTRGTALAGVSNALSSVGVPALPIGKKRSWDASNLDSGRTRVVGVSARNGSVPLHDDDGSGNFGSFLASGGGVGNTGSSSASVPVASSDLPVLSGAFTRAFVERNLKKNTR